MKRCPKCGEYKELVAFPKDRAKKDGLRPWCKLCSNKQISVYRQKPESRQAVKAYNRRYYSNMHHSVKSGHHVRQRARYQEKRLEAIKHYGDRCACCGETNPAFLGFDHINGGGNEHRRQDAGAANIVAWLWRNDFPDGFQILCHNCNMSKGFYGGCAHQRLIENSVGENDVAHYAGTAC